jgi:hypothetical protein
MDKNIIFENIYMKPKLEQRNPYSTLGPGVFLHNLINQR